MRRGGIDITLILLFVVVVFAIYLSGGVNLSKAYDWATVTPTPFSPVNNITPTATPSATVTTTPTVTP